MSDDTFATPLRQILDAGAGEIGLQLERQQVAMLLVLVRELVDWSARFNLTAIREPPDIVRKHLLDSLTLQPHLVGERVADVGTGAGFPGLPLAIADPRRHYTLIEATAKKVRFVEHVVTQLALPNVTVVNARAESWKPATRFDSVVARALASVPDFVRLAGHLVAPQGRLLAMKGQLPNQELAAIPRGWRVAGTVPLHVPGLDAARHLVILQRAADAGSRSR